MRKTLVIVVSLAIVVIGGYLFVSQKKKTFSDTVVMETPVSTIQETSFESSFDIYTNGTHRIFTDPKYHDLSPDVFIQSDNPSTIHVTKDGTTWQDFFTTLPMKLTKECLVTGTKQTFCTGSDGTLKFYINSIEDPDALDKKINAGDNLLVKFED